MPYDAATLMEMERQNSWTAVVDGDPIACGGTLKQWPRRHTAWTYMTAKTGPHMMFLTRTVKDVLKKVPGRVEMTVRYDFEQGHRWARILGFEVETPRLKNYGPESEDHTGYVRFNKG